MEKPQTGKLPWGVPLLIGIFLLLLGISVINVGTQPEQVAGRYKLLPVLPAVLYHVLFTLALLYVLLLLALVISSRREQRRKGELTSQRENPKRSFLAQMFLSLCPFLFLTLLGLYLYTYHRQEMEENLQHLIALFRDLSSLLQGESSLPVYPSSLFGYLLFGILSFLFLAFIVIGCWLLQVGVVDLQEEEEVLATENLLQAIDTSIEALSRHRDTRSGIIAAYRHFEHLLAAHGLPRHPAVTPLEFMQEVLRRFPIPPDHIAGLTILFQQAKFSLHPLSERERAAAFSHLEAIRMALQNGEVSTDVYHT